MALVTIKLLPDVQPAIVRFWLELGYGPYGDEVSRELRRGSCRQIQW